MQVYRKFFPEAIPDNEELYFAHLNGVIESVDELSCLTITRTNEAYHFRIATSLPKYNQLLLQELLKFHNKYGIRLNMSKSIKTSGTIVFDISL